MHGSPAGDASTSLVEQWLTRQLGDAVETLGPQDRAQGDCSTSGLLHGLDAVRGDESQAVVEPVSQIVASTPVAGAEGEGDAETGATAEGCAEAAAETDDTTDLEAAEGVDDDSFDPDEAWLALACVDLPALATVERVTALHSLVARVQAMESAALADVSRDERRARA